MSEVIQGIELKELALHFFKVRDMTAEEAYEHALSFLTINKDNQGRDILNVSIKYNVGLIDKNWIWTILFDGVEHNFRVFGVRTYDEEVTAVYNQMDKLVKDRYSHMSNTVVNYTLEKDDSILVSSDNAYNLAC